MSTPADPHKPAENGDVTLEEAAQRLGVHYMTAYRYVRMGKLPASKSGGQWRVSLVALDEFSTAATEPRGRGSAGRDYSGQLLTALIAGDEPTAWQIISDALASAHSLESLYSDVLSATMRRIGEMWHAGELEVAQEHLATAGMTRMVGRLSPLSRRRGPNRGIVVLACLPGDTHALATSLAADPIRHRGFSVFDLGGNTPATSLLHLGTQHDVLAFGLFAATAESQRQLPGFLREVREQLSTPILLGGQGLTPDSPDLPAEVTLIENTGQALDWLEAAAVARGARRRTVAVAPV